MGESEREPQDPQVTEPQSRRAALVFVGSLIVILAVVGVIALATGGGGEESADESAEIVCEPVPDDGANEECPTVVITEPASIDVATSEGDFTIDLDVENAPATTTSFRTLAENGFYDGLDFHRIAPGFVIQGGDPNGDGSGGPGYYVDEPVPPGTTYPPGVVAMAKTGTDPAGRSGSQFFVVTGATVQLPPDYAVVGEVNQGMGTVERIDALGTADGQPPKRPVTIDSMTVVPAA